MRTARQSSTEFQHVGIGREVTVGLAVDFKSVIVTHYFTEEEKRQKLAQMKAKKLKNGDTTPVLPTSVQEIGYQHLDRQCIERIMDLLSDIRARIRLCMGGGMLLKKSQVMIPLADGICIRLERLTMNVNIRTYWWNAAIRKWIPNRGDYCKKLPQNHYDS